jgi:hypothetical protein
MTHCTGAPAELYLERYIQGTLPDSESQQFEEHYFDCPVCLAQVEALQAVRARLSQIPPDQLPAAQPPANQLPSSQPSGKKRAPLLAWPTAAAALTALAACLLIVFVGENFVLPRILPPNVTMQTGPQSRATSQGPLNPQTPTTVPSTSLAQLADLSLPPFRATTLRGGTEDPGFVSGMTAYSSGDCHAALTALSRVPASGSNALAAQFYAGVCQMHRGDLPAAAATLQRVAAAGDSPQQEAAYYYLAQIGLARNDAPTARQNLDRTVALHGDFEQRARRQSAALAAGAGKH